MNQLRTRVLAVSLAVLVVALISWIVNDHPDAATAHAADAPPTMAARVLAASSVEAGRYLVQIGGCNDCHTDGYMMGPVPEAKWLLGSPLGWRGPWGTTYGSNLRLFVQDFTPETWVQVIRARKDRPPMPWSSVHAMSDDDLLAIYAYLKHLGPAGQPMPQFVPPDEEPTTPYRDMMPKMPAGAAGH